MHQKYIAFSFAICLLISIVVLFLSQKGANNFINQTLQSVLFPASQFVFGKINPLTNILQTGQKSESLSTQNSNLLKQLALEKSIEADNLAFKDQFATTSIPSNKLLPSHIVAAPRFVPGINLPDSYILDKGQVDGVNIGNAVVYKDNAVGLVTKVEKHFSEVALIGSANSSLTAKTSQTSALGVLKGQGNGDMILDNVLLSDKLKIGDAVATTGSENIKGNGYMPGLIIGKITSIEKSASALFQRARVSSLLKFDRLEMVFIQRENQ